MTQPRVLHPNIHVTEVTQRFKDAASTLHTGQLIKDEGFTLYEAVSALEIGDPKMDSGCLVDKDNDEEDFDSSYSLKGDEVVWIMDELICREVAWHKGYPLSQTLFTSVHIDRLLWPEPLQLSDANFTRHDGLASDTSLSDEVFRPYCLALVKCCDFVLDMVKTQHYYEEEDFATQLFNRELLHKFDADEISKTLDSAIHWINASEFDRDLKQKLDIRLRFRQQVITLLLQIRSGSPPSYEALQVALSFLKEIETSSRNDPQLPNVFSTKIQRSLASSVPPRPMVSINRDESFRFLRQFFTDATTAYQILNVSHSSDLFTAIWCFMSQEPQPSAYIRALLQSFLGSQETILGRFTIKEFVFADLASLVLPASPLLDPTNEEAEAPNHERFQIAIYMNNFITKFGQSYLNVYRSLCLNRCRIRRTMCHAALEWDQIQAEAEEMDSSLHSLLNDQPLTYPRGGMPTYSYSLSSWVYLYKLQQLRLVTQMGFELSIYAPHEISKMYWYLSSLSGTHLAHLERISYFVSSKRGKISNTTEQSDVKDENASTLGQLYRQFRWIKAVEALAESLHRLYVILQRHGHFLKPISPYASENLRFELRMRPFLHLSVPESFTYEESEQWSTLQGLSDSAIIDQATRSCLTAKKAWEEILKEKWNSQPIQGEGQKFSSSPEAAESVVEREWTKDVKGSMKACIGTSIATSRLRKLLDQAGKAQVGQKIKALEVTIPDMGDSERYHGFWAVPSIS